MPHQCVHCNKLYQDGSEELLKGCSNCGGKFFFFIRKKDMEKAKKITADLTKEEKVQMEKDVFDLIGTEMDKAAPVFLDIESINVLKPGQYEIDLVHLFKKQPLVYKLENGKYIIDLVSTFESFKKKKKKDS